MIIIFMYYYVIRFKDKIVLFFKNTYSTLFVISFPVSMSVHLIPKIPLDFFLATKANNSGIQRSVQFDAHAALLVSKCKCFTEIPVGSRNNSNNVNTSHHNTSRTSHWSKDAKGDKHSTRSVSFQDQGFHSNRFSHNSSRHDSRTSDKERVKIGGNVATKEEKAKREFFSLMNKLTHQNKAQVLKTVSDNHVATLSDTVEPVSIRMYVSIVWDMMLRNKDLQKLYIDVLHLFPEDLVLSECNRLWSEYNDLHKWLPPETISGSDIINSEYDEFCDFVKWKKHSIASVQGLFMLYVKDMIDDDVELMKTLATKLTTECTNQLSTQENKHLDSMSTCAQIGNALLEQINALVVSAKHEKSLSSLTDRKEVISIVSKFSEHHKSLADTYPPSVRFKIYDMYDDTKIELGVTHK